METQGHREKPVTVPSIIERKGEIRDGRGHPITALTAYDYTFAQILDEAGVDIILVGDSLGMVVQGKKNTLSVTLDEMIYHGRCVSAAVQRALVVVDLPYMSYQVSVERALENAGRVIKESGGGAVKLEGGVAVAEVIERMTIADIPVMGHVGMTPQSFHRMGGHRIQGKRGPRVKHALLQHGSREQIIADAKAVERAGAFAVVVEGVPAELAQEITNALSIPTIGIGAGNSCDGQVLVAPDMLGLVSEIRPKFVKRFAELRDVAVRAIQEYSEGVRDRSFPGLEHIVRESVASKSSAAKNRAPKGGKKSR